MFFIDKEHELNYKEMLIRFPLARNDYQYKMGCYITSHPELYRKAKAYIDDESPVFWAYEAIEGEIKIDLTSGEKLLIDLMLNLWNGTEGFDLSRAINVWDQKNFEVFMQSIKIVRRLDH